MDGTATGTIAGVQLRRLLARWGGLLAIALFGVALYYAVAGCVRREEDIRSAAWPSASGTVTDVEQPADDAKDQSQAAIRYRYQVSGKTYEGDRVSLHSTWPSADLRKEHPKGSEVTVYYDPRNPSFAVLEPGADAQSDIGFLYPGLFSVLLFVLVVEAVQARRLIRLVDQGELQAIRKRLGGKIQPAVSTEAGLLAADRPDPEVFSLLVPLIGTRRLRTLAAYAKQRGTLRMQERLTPALADRADDSRSPGPPKGDEAHSTPTVRLPPWIDSAIGRLEDIYEEMTSFGQLAVLLAVLLLLGVGLLRVGLPGEYGIWIFLAISLLWFLPSTIAIYRIMCRSKAASDAIVPQPSDESLPPSTSVEGKPAGRFGPLARDTCQSWVGLCVVLGFLATAGFFQERNDFGIRQFAMLWGVALAIVVLGLPFCVVIAAIRYWAGGRVEDDSTQESPGR